MHGLPEKMIRSMRKMEKKELTCINCPLGCALTVTIDGDEITVTGNTCPRGEAYGKKEVTDPTRIVTSTVAVVNGVLRRVPVKTSSDIPKGSIYDICAEIKKAQVTAPVAIGDVIIKNVAGTGADVIATRNVTVQAMA